MNRMIVSAWLLVALLMACGKAPSVLAPHPLALGEQLTSAPHLADARRTESTVDVLARLGTRATVLIGWSVPCPCTQKVEARVRRLLAHYGQDVRWIALDGEPLDTRAQVMGRIRRMGSTYDILLDPEQRLCALLGIERSSQAVVLDARGRLVYRGGLDDDFPSGEGEFLRSILDVLMTGSAPSPTEREPDYGCRFNDPTTCTVPPRID